MADLRRRSPGQLIQPDREGMSREELGSLQHPFIPSSPPASLPALPPSFLPLSFCPFFPLSLPLLAAQP